MLDQFDSYKIEGGGTWSIYKINDSYYELDRGGYRTYHYDLYHISGLLEGEMTYSIIDNWLDMTSDEAVQKLSELTNQVYKKRVRRFI